MEPKVIIIVGPTCSGKTDLSLKLAQRLNSEIISADSRQGYKHLNIGTAKPSPNEIGKIKHHFIDFLNPDENFNASIFEKSSLNIISELIEKKISPIVVGGSGLYIKAIVDGIFDSVDTDKDYRQELAEMRNLYGNEYLLKMLDKVDPKTASLLLPQNWKRIFRALEVFYITGEPIWKHQKHYKRDINFDFLQFGLNWNRDILYSNIEIRVDKMIEKGLVEEVKKILAMGYVKELNSLNTVGYKEIIEFLENKITLERAIELIKRNTRRYAKRQMTWFRKDERIKWFDVKDKDDLFIIAEKIEKQVTET